MRSVTSTSKVKVVMVRTDLRNHSHSKHRNSFGSNYAASATNSALYLDKAEYDSNNMPDPAEFLLLSGK